MKCWPIDTFTLHSNAKILFDLSSVCLVNRKKPFNTVALIDLIHFSCVISVQTSMLLPSLISILFLFAIYYSFLLHLFCVCKKLKFDTYIIHMLCLQRHIHYYNTLKSGILLTKVYVLCIHIVYVPDMSLHFNLLL